MAVPTISQLPEAPNRATDSPSTFSSKADAWADAVVGFVPEANTLAGFADTKASEADTSATNAANSESAAATSETNAANSESAAATSESNAATSETNAANSESAAATSESNAATSANNAATDAGVAQSAANTAVEASSAVASSTSSTSLNVSTGAKSLTVGLNAGFVSGATIEIIYRADSSIVMSGTVTSYNASSGALGVNIASVSGSGTFSDWVVRVPLTVSNLDQSGATSGDVLKWDGSKWTPGSSPAILAPSLVAPADGATDIGETPTLDAGGFFHDYGKSHEQSQFQVASDSSFSTIVYDSGWISATQTHQVPGGNLNTSTTYYWRARYEDADGQQSDWAQAFSFTTADAFFVGIGQPGTVNFGVGTYPDTLPTGFSELTGTTDETSSQFGNYQYSDGSVLVFIPAFYYRIGDSNNPTFGTYGANSIDVQPISAFSSRTAAETAGYALHRAFIDGGATKYGFFIDKYLASPNGTSDAAKSVSGGVPISLDDNTSYTNSADMGGQGQLSDAVMLARARGAGTFNVASVFMYSALAMLSLAHGQAATGTADAAWYDSADTTNYPKGANSSLGDVDDANVSYTSAGDSGSADKPLTGSGTPFAKTTHNGQDSGVADLNGAMWQALLGVTYPATNATDGSSIQTTDIWVLSESTALADLTEGHNSGTDAWGNASHLGALYDEQTGLLPWNPSTAGNVQWGNGSNQVLDPSVSGQGWLKTAMAVQKDTASVSASGSNLFGQDRFFQNVDENLFVLASGYWNLGSYAGVWYRRWAINRTNYNALIGFRAAAYGS